MKPLLWALVAGVAGIWVGLTLGGAVREGQIAQLKHDLQKVRADSFAMQRELAYMKDGGLTHEEASTASAVVEAKIVEKISD